MLVKGGAVVDDVFANVADGDALPAGPVIVSLARYLSERDGLEARGTPLGVRIESSQSPEALGAHVHGLAVVVLVVPAFRDGRAFSWARLLRTRLGYKGEIRVTGHFLRDQLAFFVRVGVDAFDLKQNLSLEEFHKALTEIGEVYQPSVDGRPTIRDLRTRK